MTVCVRKSGVDLPLAQRETVAGETATMFAMSLPWSPPPSRRRSRTCLTAAAMVSADPSVGRMCSPPFGTPITGQRSCLLASAQRVLRPVLSS